MGRLRMRVVVVVEVGPSVSVRPSLVQWVGRGRLGWMGVVRDGMG